MEIEDYDSAIEEMSAFNIIKDNPGITRKQLVNKLDLDEKDVVKFIHNLLKLSLIYKNKDYFFDSGVSIKDSDKIVANQIFKIITKQIISIGEEINSCPTTKTVRRRPNPRNGRYLRDSNVAIVLMYFYKNRYNGILYEVKHVVKCLKTFIKRDISNIIYKLTNEGVLISSENTEGVKVYKWSGNIEYPFFSVKSGDFNICPLLPDINHKKEIGRPVS